MTELNWRVVHLDKKPTAGNLSDVVVEAHWTLEASEGIYKTTIYGSVVIPFSGTSDFVPFDELTESVVVGWVKAVLGHDGVDRYEEAVQRQLQSIVAPSVVAAPVPWGTSIQNTVLL